MQTAMGKQKFLFLFLIFVFVTEPKAHALPAFPGAQGFGSETVGGSGRQKHPAQANIIKVITLNPSGPGSLQACVDFSGPRTCLFEVSGRISLNAPLEIREPFLTIAGQTAPTPGIMLTGAGLKIMTHDVIVRHLSIRVGDSPNGPKASDRDGITVTAAKAEAFNILLDHLSLTWAIDENMDIYGEKAHDITLSNTIVAEGLFHSIHSDGPHSMGMLINEGAQRISVHHCLFAHNNDRNPRIKAGSTVEFLNNLVYNWGGTGAGHQVNPSDTDKTNRATLLNFGGNYFLPGPQSPRRETIYVKPASEGFRAYLTHNIGPKREKDEGSEWKLTNLPGTPFQAITPTFPPSGIRIESPAEIANLIPSMVGSRPQERDSVDSRILSEVKSRSGLIRDCLEGCERNTGGWPTLSTNHRELRIPSDPFMDSDKNGYTNLEDWLNCLATSLESVERNIGVAKRCE